MASALPPPEQCVALLRFLADDIAQWVEEERVRREETPSQRIRRTALLPGEFKRRVAARREAAEFVEDHDEDEGRQRDQACKPRRRGLRR